MRAWFVLVLMFSSIANANGERERISVMADRVRWGISHRAVMPDAPPNIRNRTIAPRNAPAVPPLLDDSEILRRHSQELDSLKEEIDRLQRLLEKNTVEPVVPIREPEPVPQLEPEPEPQKKKKPVASTSFQLPVMSFAQAESPVDEPYDVFIATIYNCAPCRTLKEKLPHGDSRARVRYVQLQDKNNLPCSKPDWMSDHEWRQVKKSAAEPNVTVPLAVWFDAKGHPVYLKLNGSSTLDYIVSIIEKPANNPPPRRRPQAMGAAGAIHDYGAVGTMLDWIEAHVGNGVEMTARVDRTGKQTISLLKAGKDWPFKDLFGLSGRFAVTAKGAIDLPIDSLAFTYLVDGDDLVLTPEGVRVKGLIPKSVVPGGSVGESPAGDPITISLTIISIVQTVWGILNPSADLRLGGTLSATGVLNDGKLVVQFKDMPSVRLVMLFAFELGVKQVAISRDNVHVDFTGSWFVKSRDFRIASVDESIPPMGNPIPSEPNQKSDVIPYVAKVPSGWHSHKCDHRGTQYAGQEPSVWSHSSSSFGKYPDHQCPLCGKYQFDVWKRF